MMMCTDSRFEIIAKAKKDILETTNINTSPDEMKVLDNFLFRCWQMDWLKMYEQPKVRGWIPCSERLPQEDEKVLCTEKDTEKIYLGWCLRIDDVGIRWIDTDGFSMEVIAWMPLPPAYKGE